MTQANATPRLPTYWLAAVSLGLGALHALCFAPGPLPVAALAPLQWLVWLALPMLVWRAGSPRRAALAGACFGLAQFTVGLYWLYISMHHHGGLPAILAALAVLLFAAVLSLYYAGAAAGSQALATGDAPPWQRVLAWTTCWTLAEWLRGTLLTGFPWLNAGYGQVDGPLTGWAPISGVYGMTWVLVFGGASLAAWALPPARNPLNHATRPLAPLATAVVLVLTGWALSRVPWTQPTGDPITVRLVQGNVPQSLKFDPQQLFDGIHRYQQLAAQPAPAGHAPQLIVLPETIMPLFQNQFAVELWQRWVDLAAATGSTVVMGAPLRTSDGTDTHHTNSTLALDGSTAATALQAGQPLHRYDKVHLVPFGEFIPPGFRWFVNAMNIPLGDFSRGAPVQPPLVLDQQRLAMNICYEDVFGEEIIRAVRPTHTGGAQATLLVNVSNLGWFGNSWALRQHAQIARLRSVETGRPTLRATNTGITAHISPKGQVLAALPAHEAGILDITVQGMTGTTPYVRWGNLPLIAILLASLATLLRTRRPPPAAR